MHFTREPIIESVLSARDGFKLVLKSSKLNQAAEISAEVIEIVSFAGAVFYRSQDRSKNFLLPAADFEVSEVKDTRLVLKNISLEKSNKLQNLHKEAAASAVEPDFDQTSAEENVLVNEAEASTQQSQQQGQSSRSDRRRERRRNRRRRHNEERQTEDKKEVTAESVSSEEEVVSVESEITSAPIPTINLIPPPTTLISQTLARYKEKAPDTEQAPPIVIEENYQEQSFEPPLEPEDMV